MVYQGLIFENSNFLNKNKFLYLIRSNYNVIIF